MNINSASFTGCIQWSKFKPRNDTWGSIACRVGLPIFESKYLGEEFTVVNPIVWINISVDHDKGAIALKHKNLLDSLTVGTHVFIADSKLTHWDTSQGEKRFSVDVAADDISTSDSPYPVINQCKFGGIIDSMDPNGKTIMEISYKTKSGTKKRCVPLVNSRGYRPEYVGNSAAAFGKICGRKPDGTDELYIMADAIVPL